MMKILHVNDVAGVASNYVTGLRELGVSADLYQPTIGAYWFGGTWKTRVMLPYTRTKEAFKLRQMVKKNQYDVLHIHYGSIAYMALITGMEFFLHIHGKDILEDIYKPGLRQLTLKALRSARRVFCATPDLLDKVTPFRADAVFIPNPIDFTLFSPAPAKPSEKVRILSISKLDKRKGVESICETLELMWQAYPDIVVSMFNFGTASKAHQSFVDRNRQRLELLDRIPHTEMVNLINSYDIILGQQSTIASTLTLSELESMACAKPVVVNFRYGHVYPEPPPVLESPTPQQAFAHLDRLIKSPELRAQCGAASREWVLKIHDRSKSSQVLLENYRQVMAEEERVKA